MRSLALTVLVVTALAPIARAHAAPPTPQQRVAIEKLLLHRVFPGPTADSPLACAWGAGATCTAGSTHLTFAAPTAVPTLAACQGAAQSIQTCYLAAVTRLQDALEAGDVLTLFEAAYRTKDVIARAKAPGSGAPAWLAVEGPANLLWNFFATHGLPVAQAGNCRTGTADARYTCLGALPRTTYRGALGALDEHNAILVRNGRLTNARTRALAIFRGGSAPMTIGIVTTGAFNPTIGAGGAYVHELGKYFFLRAYEGLMTGAGAGAEVTHLNTLRGYKAAGQAAGPTAYAMIVATDLAGSSWDRAAGRPVVLDAALHGDAAELIKIAGWTRALVGVRGGTTSSTDLLARAVATPMTLDNLSALSNDGFWLRWQDVLEDQALTQAGQWGETCGWVTVEDIFAWDWVEETAEERYFDEDCAADVMRDCLENHKGDVLGCYEDHESECWLTRTVTYLKWEETDTVIGQDILVSSISEGYRALLDSNDGVIYDRDSDGDPELNYVGAAPATINKAGVRAGDATSGCLGELGALGGDFSTTFSVSGDGANSDASGGIDEDLTQTFGASGAHAAWDFVPYPVAARICPAFTADVVGVAGSVFRQFPMTAITKIGGVAAPITYARSCDTPWDYTNRVADLLGDPDLAQLRRVIAGDLPAGETLSTLIMDFANEALLLSVPVAGAYQQQADLAYVAGEVPNGGSATAWYGDHVGLDNLDAALATAKTPLVKGLNLVEEFGAIVTGLIGATGAEAIPTLSQAGFATCDTVGCSDNSNTQTRALFYKRVRDALDLYQRNVRGRFEVSWRRLDGALTSACLGVTDTDNDGFAETVTCDAAAAGCADACADHDTALALVESVDLEMPELAAMLAAQAPHLTDAALVPYVADLQTYADAIAGDLHTRLAQLDAGIDWLGQRAGRWVPPIDVDAETDLDVLLGTLDASSSSFGYEDFIDGYLRNLASTDALAQTEIAASGDAYDSLAGYCSDGGDIDATGCGMTSSLTETADALIEQVNASLRANLCEATLTLYYSEQVDNNSFEVRSTTETIDLTDPAYAAYKAQLVGMGFVDGCPQLVGPSFADLTRDTGSVANGLAEVQRRLVDLQLQLDALRLQREQMEADSRAAAELGVTLDTFTIQHDRLERAIDGVLCGTAVIGAGIACGAFTFITEGFGIEACVPAIGGAVEACAALAEDDLFGGQITQNELQSAYYQYSTTMQQDAALAQYGAAIDTVVGGSYDYQDALLVYFGLRDAFARALAVTDQTMAAMYLDPASDPTAWFFQDQGFEGMVSQFQDYAEQVRTLHHLVEYSTGHALAEGIALPIGATTYCLPRLADLTVYKSYGAQFGAARSSLAQGSCDAVTEVADLNLVAMASVLARLVDKFDDVYGARASTDAWVVGAGSALGGTDRDGDGRVTILDSALARSWNPGEWAMLADSGFYDPVGYVDVDSDGDGVVCPAGQIDLDDVCASFTDGATVLDDTCFDPRTLPDLTRVNLAYLDHMLRGEHAVTFACTNSAPSYGVAVAVTPYFTYAQLGGTPTWLSAATGAEVWHAGQPNTITEGYYLAQTRTVRGVLDRLVAEGSVTDTGLGVQSINRVPGTFLFLLDTASPVGGAIDTSPLFDMELDLLTEDVGATQSMAEHLVSMAFLCTDDMACPDPGPHQVDLIQFGDGELGDRYQKPSGRQEQVPYRMGPHAFDAPTSWSAKVLDPASDPAVGGLLADPNVQVQFARRPLHVNSMLLAVAGAANFDGEVYLDDLNGQETRWALYTSFDTPSRIRIKARYTYFGTTADETSSFSNVDDMLPCVGADTHLISDTNQACTLVSPY